MTQCDDLEPVGGLGTAAAIGGSVKSRRLGQICVGANTPTLGSTNGALFASSKGFTLASLDC